LSYVGASPCGANPEIINLTPLTVSCQRVSTQ